MTTTTPAPAPPQIPAGYAPFPADFTSWVTTPFSFLASTTLFRGQLQGVEALSGWTLAKLDTVLEDPYGGWSATGSGSQGAWTWQCPAGCGGWYEITLTGMSNAQSGTAEVWTALYVDGSPYQVASGSLGSVTTASGSSGTLALPLLPGDYVGMYIYSSGAVNTPATAGRYPGMEIAWISS
jgi:hypothetical protein